MERKRRKKKEPELGRILLVLGSLAVAICLALVLIPENKGYDEFLDALGYRESTDNYALVNKFGHMGRYQMGGEALEEAGFKDENGKWTALANSYGIYSKEDFLNCPEGQDYAIAAYHKVVCGYIRAYNLERYVGTTYCGVKVTRSGLLAACHLVGIGSMRKALASGEPSYDGYGTPASEYLDLFGGYNIREVWKE
ncbi:MAG: hypothetical protein IKY17_00840 [Oscillospiraceae bacterium]|nr:hypothetical protein [Oscillospiraceae bacterium]